MHLTHQDRDSLTVLSLRGDFLAGDTDAFRKAAIERMDAKIRDFVIDCARLDTVDSRGLETLLWLKAEAEDRLGQVRLANPPEHVRIILECTRLSGRLECADGIDAAIGSLR